MTAGLMSRKGTGGAGVFRFDRLAARRSGRTPVRSRAASAPVAPATAPAPACLSAAEIAALVQSLAASRGPSRRVVFNALRSLGAAAAPALAEALPGATDPEFRQDAAHLLGQTGSSTAR